MRLVAISCVRNELDIIEAFVRHTLAHVDHLVVLDNGSTDGTRQILDQLMTEGLALDVVDDPTPGNYQWSRMTALMRDHALVRHHADWVVPLDADEFLIDSDLKSVLATDAATDRPFGLVWKSYVPDPVDDPRELNPVRRIQHRLVREARPCVKVAVPAALAKRPDIALDQGSHQVIGATDLLPPVFGTGGHLAHFPGRSPDQFAVKVVLKHIQYLAMAARHPDWGHHYQTPIALLRLDPHEFADTFREMMLRYGLRGDESFEPEVVADPITYAGGALKYTPAISDSRTVTTLLECAEEFAGRYAALVRNQEVLTAALSRLEHEARNRDTVVAALQVANQALHRSWTWRAGRFVVGPARWAKRLVRGPWSGRRTA